MWEPVSLSIWDPYEYHTSNKLDESDLSAGKKNIFSILNLSTPAILIPSHKSNTFIN